ncbi:MAG: sugar transferase [Gammaproteobacteria bacterium]|nr:sugar transferase [Gammaproteobacteria bacterium]
MKRLFDFIVSLFALIILSPLFIVLSITVIKKIGRPIFFRQERPGHNGVIFMMFKFRTMLETKDEEGNYLSDEQRLTSFGQWLRSTSLDELPELWNVLKGDMSFVGPRPLLVEYLPLYNKMQKRRHQIKPGITGWAQINGRNAISWDEKFNLDVWYVDNHTFFLDLKIIFTTFMKVIKRSDISYGEHVTMEKFKGNR